jgi:hypothetical protein
MVIEDSEWPKVHQVEKMVIEDSEWPKIRQVEKISEQSMPPNYTDMLRHLEMGEGLRTPCRWEHKGGCSGGRNIHSAARRVGIRISIKCDQKILYCLRVA